MAPRTDDDINLIQAIGGILRDSLFNRKAEPMLVSLDSITPNRWSGDLTDDKLNLIVTGLLVPAPSMYHRVAYDLLDLRKAVKAAGAVTSNPCVECIHPNIPVCRVDEHEARGRVLACSWCNLPMVEHSALRMNWHALLSAITFHSTVHWQEVYY